ncbi:sensor histidine kinase [Leisingera sp. ANG-M1]|uniref:sensor histidine kinase n=1 Tax=Leisingera sp. ANG-M1 TaxID=1577895 RepID=UPI00068F57D9|nr:HAMP domain-containing sensor histidine kinase [Leisingera sp. ANG-M1]
MSALRQSLVLALCLFLLQIVGAILAGLVVRSEFDQRVEEDLSARFSAIASEIQARGFDPAHYPNDGKEAVYFQADTASAASAPEGIFALRGLFDDDRWDRSPETPLAMSGGHWYYYAGEAGGSVLVVGSNLGTGTFTLIIVPLTFFSIGLAVSLIAVLLGAVFSFHSQKRLSRMARVLDQVALGQLEARVAPAAARDDLDDLAQNIDRTLERLEVLFNQSRNIAANIAHDLKTPLARLRLRLENALLLEDPEESKDNVAAALTQADHIIAVFEAFLRIARLESGNARKRFALVSLAEIAAEVATTFAPVAEDAGYEFTTRISSSRRVLGDAVLLTQMLTNLIENAMRHTPPGSRISLIASQTELGVADNGPGLPPGAYSEVIKPSVRLDRSRTTPGAGLGLALVKAISDAHDARLLLSPAADGGLYVRARFSAQEIVAEK